MSKRSWTYDAVDLAAPDHLPACAHCGDLGEPGDEVCGGCGRRLYPQAAKAPPPTARLAPAERWLVAEGLAESIADGLVPTERGYRLAAGIN